MGVQWGKERAGGFAGGRRRRGGRRRLGLGWEEKRVRVALVLVGLRVRVSWGPGRKMLRVVWFFR